MTVSIKPAHLTTDDNGKRQTLMFQVPDQSSEAVSTAPDCHGPIAHASSPNKQMVNEFDQSPYCHPYRRQMDSSDLDHIKKWFPGPTQISPKRHLDRLSRS